MKHIARVMCLVLLVATAPRVTSAQDEKGSKKEAAEFAHREAQAPELLKFEGGDAAGVLVFILVVAAIAALVYLLIDHHHAMKSPADREATSPVRPPPPMFR